MKGKWITVVLTAALTSAGTAVLLSKINNNNHPVVSYNNSPAPAKFAGFGDDNSAGAAAAGIDFRQAAESSVKAVVHIKTTTKARTVAVTRNPFDDFWGDFFGQRQQGYIPPQMGSGSGVVASPDGYIVTNNHVVAGADQVTVTFNDRITTQAKVVGTDPSTDLAVLKVEEKNLPYIEFGNSDNVHLGQWVLAVGYPLTLDATVTAGIVSAKSRAIGINRSKSSTPIESFIQTDAAVNPGNSGGALVNTAGQLIGINSAIASPTGSYAGYPYAIPSNIVRKVVTDLTKYGTVQRGYIGIKMLDTKSANPEEISALGLDRNPGVYVEGTMPGGGAENAGIRSGDFITKINGVTVSSEPQLMEQVSLYKPGDNVSVTYTRAGKEMMTTVQLKNISGNTSVVKNETNGKVLGATLRALNSSELSKYGISSGVLVSSVGNGILRQRTSMQDGFVITSINDQSVKTVSEVQSAIAASADALQLSGFYPGKRGMYYYGLSAEELTAPIER